VRVLTIVGILCALIGCTGKASETYRGVKLRYDQNAKPPWPCFRQSTDILYKVVEDYYPGRSVALMQFWLSLIGPDDVMRTNESPEGLNADGKPLLGTLTTESEGVWYHRLVVIRETSYEGTNLVRPAGDTEYPHEVLEHLMPLLTTGNQNNQHDPKWAAHNKDYHDRFMATIGPNCIHLGHP